MLWMRIEKREIFWSSWRAGSTVLRTMNGETDEEIRMEIQVAALIQSDILLLIWWTSTNFINLIRHRNHQSNFPVKLLHNRLGHFPVNRIWWTIFAANQSTSLNLTSRNPLRLERRRASLSDEEKRDCRQCRSSMEVWLSLLDWSCELGSLPQCTRAFYIFKFWNSKLQVSMLIQLGACIVYLMRTSTRPNFFQSNCKLSKSKVSARNWVLSESKHPQVLK